MTGPAVDAGLARGRRLMSLLERIKAHPLPFAELIGIEFVRAEPDAVEARMVVRPDLCTLGAIAHGGAVISFSGTHGRAAGFLNLSSHVEGGGTPESKT